MDRAGLQLLPALTHASQFRVVTSLGTAPALALGSIGAALVAWRTWPEDRGRVVACLVGPFAAAALDELVVKPVVGRRYLGELSFASGHVTAVSAVVTAWALAVPRWARPLAVGIGTVLVVLMVLAVVALRWHYASDALAGIVFGSGVVLLVAGLFRIGSAGRRGSDGGAPPDASRLLSDRGDGPYPTPDRTKGSGYHRAPAPSGVRTRGCPPGALATTTTTPRHDRPPGEGTATGGAWVDGEHG